MHPLVWKYQGLPLRSQDTVRLQPWAIDTGVVSVIGWLISRSTTTTLEGGVEWAGPSEREGDCRRSRGKRKQWRCQSGNVCGLSVIWHPFGGHHSLPTTVNDTPLADTRPVATWSYRHTHTYIHKMPHTHLNVVRHKIDTIWLMCCFETQLLTS